MMDFAWLSEVADLFLPGAAEASRGLDPAIFQTVVRGSVLVLNDLLGTLVPWNIGTELEPFRPENVEFPPMATHRPWVL